MRESIDTFSGEFAWLSNFHMEPVSIDLLGVYLNPPADTTIGIIYPSVEHSYQAAKAVDIKDHRAIAAALTPGQSKKLGR